MPTYEEPGSKPKINSTPMTKNTMITATLKNANQNSNSPKPRTSARLTAAKNATQISAGIHGSTPNHCPIMAAAPVISAPSTMVSMNQYSQPSEKPAQRPNAISA